jgi:hypothetical protein
MFVCVEHSTYSSTQTPRLAPRLMLGLMNYKVWADVELLQLVAAHPELLATPETLISRSGALVSKSAHMRFTAGWRGAYACGS